MGLLARSQMLEVGIYTHCSYVSSAFHACIKHPSCMYHHASSAHPSSYQSSCMDWKTWDGNLL